MTTRIQTDIAIIGGGSGGLSVAAGASQMGANVVLIEHHKMGGDCLNVGCVPSKSLLAAAKSVYQIQQAEKFGASTQGVEVDFSKVMQHVKSVINAIAPNDSVERFEGLGVKVILSNAKFINQNTVLAGEYEVTAKRFVIATGSSPFVPPIPGLKDVVFYTNETIFDLTEKPSHLIIIGGGPIGCEIAQAFLMLGCKVTVLEMFNILPKDDIEMVEISRKNFIKQGLEIHENIKILDVNNAGNNQIAINIESQGETKTISGSHVLVATGRRPIVNTLNLESAKVIYSPKGIQVDQYLRTSNKKIYAIGDCVGPYLFTHIAGYHAGIVIKNILFKLFAKVDYSVVPWVTYTEPELAQVGLIEKDAVQKYKDCRVLNWSFDENDRAQAEKETMGKIKVITDKKGYILGVTILGKNAGELLLPWIILMQNKLKISKMTDCIVPYPTLSEISKRAAGQFYTPLLFSDKMKKWVKLIQRLIG